MRRISVSRVTGWSIFLGLTFLLALTLWDLPQFLDLDQFRPDLIEALQNTSHCTVLMGNIRGQLIPSPGFFIGHVSFVQPSAPHRVLAAVNGVRVWIAARSLLEGQLRFSAIRFYRPRFTIH